MIEERNELIALLKEKSYRKGEFMLSSGKKSEHYIEDRIKGQCLQPFDDYVNEVDTIFEILEGVVDKYYAKIEKAKSKQPTAEWED